MSKRVMILNGPNLNLLGVREPHIYGNKTLADIEQACRQEAQSLGLAITFYQSNYEGALVEWIHEARAKADGVIINPAAYTFTSMAIFDALKMFEGPIIELHISNIHRREAVYHNSLISRVATAVICGLGTNGYTVALQALAQLLDAQKS